MQYRGTQRGESILASAEFLYRIPSVSLLGKSPVWLMTVSNVLCWDPLHTHTHTHLKRHCGHISSRTRVKSYSVTNDSVLWPIQGSVNQLHILIKKQTHLSQPVTTDILHILWARLCACVYVCVNAPLRSFILPHHSTDCDGIILNNNDNNYQPKSLQCHQTVI